MAEIKFGHVEGPGRGKEFTVAATQTFARRGGKFVKLVSGIVTICATGDAVVYGWAKSQKDDSGKISWTSSTTSGEDSVFVISGLEDVFELPVDEGNASLSTTYRGAGAGLIMTGATKSKIQRAKLGEVTASPISIIDIDTVNKTVRARIKPTAFQAN